MCYAVVKLLSKLWWIPTDARLEGPKLEPEGLRAEMGFPTADQGFSSIQGTLFGLYGISIVFFTHATSIHTKHGQMQITV